MSIGIAGAAAFLAAICSCAPKAATSSGLVDTGNPALHAIKSDELKAAMRDMDRKTSAPEDVRVMSMAGTTSPDMSNVATSARALSLATINLCGLVENMNIADEDRCVCAKWARKLRDEANDLKTQAEHGNLLGARAAMQRIDITCTSCHASFRPPLAAAK